MSCPTGRCSCRSPSVGAARLRLTPAAERQCRWTDRRMRVSVTLLLATFATFTPDSGVGKTSDSAAEAALANPCAVISVALGPDQNGRRSCNHLRAKGGHLVMSAELEEGSSTRDLLRANQSCPGGYVGVNRRPPRRENHYEYLDLTFSVQDERTLAFEGWYRMFSREPDGEFSEIGRACGAEVGGTVHLVEGHWRLIGDRYTGCSE